MQHDVARRSAQSRYDYGPRPMRCRNRAVVFVVDAGAAVAACKPCARTLQELHGARFLERLTKLRRCEADRELVVAPASDFAMVIAEAIPRCACGAGAEVCLPCATRAAKRPGLARAIDRRKAGRSIRSADEGAPVTINFR